MGTEGIFLAEVKRNGKWTLNTEDVFYFPEDAWQREKGDERTHWAHPFSARGRFYELFGFLAGVRNESKTIVLAEPRGVPADTSDESLEYLAPYYDRCNVNNYCGQKVDDPQSAQEFVERCSGDRFCYSYFLLSELLAFDYDQPLVDKSEEPPFATTYRKFLSEIGYFDEIEALKKLGSPENVRILFCFEG